MRFRCPNCDKSISISAVMAAAGRKGGSVSGPTKRRDVDYAALSRLAVAAKARKKALREGSK
jgi:hypothetical protein